MAFTDRSAQTRAAILAAARRRFAAEGYDRATIRAIAADAGIDPSMVIRYFGGKDALYLAATEVRLPVPDLGDGSEVGPRIARALLAAWEAGEETTGWEIVLRTAVTRPESAGRVQELVSGQLAPALRAAFPADEHLEQRAALMATQTLGLIYSRYILALEPIASMDPATIEIALGRALQSHLTVPLEHAG